MIPVEDYLEIVLAQYGFDSYEDLKKAGYDPKMRNSTSVY